MRQFIKSLIPPILLKIKNSILNNEQNKYGWFGNYSSWQDAKAESIGYDDDKILQKVKDSLIKVRDQKAVYERDSVLFDEIQYSWALLSGLMFAIAKSDNEINIIDFGGSLGSTYFQNKKFIDQFDNITWNIVEQENFIKVGKENFEDNVLKFSYTIREAYQKEKSNILILSSVLQYIEEPYKLLENLLQYNYTSIIVDRTSFSFDDKDIIKIQKVNPIIYDASYPNWFFDEKYFIQFFLENGYELQEVFKSNDNTTSQCIFKGMIFGKNNI